MCCCFNENMFSLVLISPAGGGAGGGQHMATIYRRQRIKGVVGYRGILVGLCPALGGSKVEESLVFYLKWDFVRRIGHGGNVLKAKILPQVACPSGAACL
jgi:hypothetical protein